MYSLRLEVVLGQRPYPCQALLLGSPLSPSSAVQKPQFLPYHLNPLDTKCGWDGVLLHWDQCQASADHLRM